MYQWWIRYDGKKIFAKICTYTYAFRDYTKWLYLNGIDYECIEPTQYYYTDGLEIIIFEQENKEKQMLAGYFMANIFPLIRDRHKVQYNL